MEQDLPSLDLTAESRELNHFMIDWHKTTNDHQFDIQLDTIFADKPVPEDCLYSHPLDKRFDWSMPINGGADHMDEQAKAPATATGATEVQAQASPASTLEDRQAVSQDATGGIHAPNDFDNPDYHIQTTRPVEHDSSNDGTSPSIAAKEDPATIAGTSAYGSTFAPVLHIDTHMAKGPHQLQRVATEPIIPSSSSTMYHHSHGMPISNGSFNQVNGVHQGLFSSTANGSHSNGSFGDLRTQHIPDFGATSYHHQQYSPYHHRSSTWRPSPPLGACNANLSAYAPTQLNNGVSYEQHAAAGKYDASFDSQDLFANGSSRQFNISDNKHRHMLTSNSMRGNINNNHPFHDNLSDNHSFYSHNHAVALAMMNQNNSYLHSAAIHGHIKVPDDMILKSQPPPRTTEFGGNKRSSRARSRSKVEQRIHDSEMSEEESDPELPDVELQYTNIDQARAAERPKVRTQHQKDETIPRTDEEKQCMVLGLFNEMYRTDKAQDNPGMINQWMKLRQDHSRVEQACWRVLDMCMRIHVEGVPLVPNKASCQRYSKMKYRWGAICKGLKTQKTMCKHLLGADFSAQLVNDPETATSRVTNNRKVNAGKKNFLNIGKQTAQTGQGNNTRSNARGGGCISPGDDSVFGGMDDEDAEGEFDNDYQYFPENVANTYRALPAIGSMPRQASGSARPRKRELEDEESDYATGRAKKAKRTTAASRRTSAKGKGSTSKKQRHPEGYRSKYQAIRKNGTDTLIDLGDIKNEQLVMELGNPQQQARFESIHYPKGRPSGGNGSRRSSRAAAPTSFHGLNNSDEIENDEAGSQYEGTDDGHHQGTPSREA
ncbi:MAG: hypothetical protein Q9207_003553 [Kuettlingeria erythrocarpa]